jgi:hypothetical protein
MLRPRSCPWLLCFCVALAVPAYGGTARADTPTKQEARTLFQEALAHVAAGDHATALGKLERVAAFKRTPQVGFYIGFCHEKMGKLVMALGEYRIALADAQAAGASDVVAEAQEAIARVEPRIPRLTLHRGENAETASISVDGKPLGDPAIGQPMPFDPGTRVIVAQASGFLPFRQEVRLAEGEKASIEVKMVKRSPGAVVAPTPGPTDPKDDGASPSSPASTTLDTEGGSNTLAWVATGIGVVGLGASGYFLMQRSKAISDLDDACAGNRNACPTSMQGTYDDGKRDTMFANVALGVGVVGVATGVVLFLTSGGGSSEGETLKQPDQPGLSVRVEPPSQGGWAGLRVDGRF